MEAALGKGIVTTETLRKALASPATQYVVDPHAIVGATRAMLAFQATLGLTDTAPSTDGLFDTRFFEEAQAEATPK